MGSSPIIGSFRCSSIGRAKVHYMCLDYAWVVELADTCGLSPHDFGREGSSPSLRIILFTIGTVVKGFNTLVCKTSICRQFESGQSLLLIFWRIGQWVKTVAFHATVTSSSLVCAILKTHTAITLKDTFWTSKVRVRISLGRD